MASINYAAREINVKIVYYGPGLSGKTTNLQVIHRKVPPEFKSDMVSLATETDRTLFFDFLPLDLGKIKGFSTKFQLYTVPGQVYYNATRKLVLRGVDGIVFVADSGQDKIEENLESFQNLEDNLAEYGYKRESIPIIIQYNKRDLPNALPVEELEQYVNKYNLPFGEAVANKGIGVFDSLKLIGKIVIDYLNKKYSRGARGSSGNASRPMPPRPQAAPPRPIPPPRMQQSSPAQYNQLGQQPKMPPQRPPFQGGQPVQQQQQYQPPQMRQPAPTPRMAPQPVSFPAAMPPKRPSPQPMQGYQPQQPVDHGHFEIEPMQMQQPEAPQANPVHTETYDDHAVFEVPNQQQAIPPTAPAQEEYYSYGSINLEPMDQQQSAVEQQESYNQSDYAQQPLQQPQGADGTVSGKTDLDMEIERYQREIEEKQRKMRSSGAAPQQAGSPPGYPPQQQQAPMPPPPPRQQPPRGSDNVQQDYDVYNMDMQSYGTPQPQQQPMIGGSDDEEMYFTSVDKDRQKKPVRRPVNPRTQQQKGFLSKFFNKDMP